jgi:hypothetical protein
MYGLGVDTRMDELQKYCYGLELRIACREKHGNEFQSFFEKVMSSKHGEDFKTIRPYGNKGDMKCDGYIASTQVVFQCYAPEGLLPLDYTLKKIDTDFEGAKTHWPDMTGWTFVTNQKALPAEVTQTIENLDKAHSGIKVDNFGYESFRVIVFSLPIDRLVELFGHVPTTRDMNNLTFLEVQPVLKYLQKTKPDPLYPVNAPSVTKLEANDLSSDVEGLLRLGRLQESLVQNYFDRNADPDIADEIAQSYREKYQELKRQGLLGDDIFLELQKFTGGPERGTPSKEAAVLAVMSYFFERCDIFEDAEIQS